MSNGDPKYVRFVRDAINDAIDEAPFENQPVTTERRGGSPKPKKTDAAKHPFPPDVPKPVDE